VCWFQRRSGERARVRSLALRAPRLSDYRSQRGVYTTCMHRRRTMRGEYVHTYVPRKRESGPQ